MPPTHPLPSHARQVQDNDQAVQYIQAIRVHDRREVCAGLLLHGHQGCPLVKNDPYEVALIFEYPRTEHNNLFSKIDLCLEAFAVSNRAKNAFTGGGAEPAAGPAAPTGPGAF